MGGKPNYAHSHEHQEGLALQKFNLFTCSFLVSQSDCFLKPLIPCFGSHWKSPAEPLRGTASIALPAAPSPSSFPYHASVYVPPEFPPLSFPLSHFLPQSALPSSLGVLIATLSDTIRPLHKKSNFRQV